jgi:sugar lactone lactonase YvrE
MNRFVFCFLLCFFCLTQLEAHPGTGIVSDSKGNIFYTDLIHVWKITPEGKKSIAVKNVHTHELYIDEHDNLYGEHEWYKGEKLDRWGNFVWCLNSSGEYEISIPEVDGFLENNTLVRDSENNSYWSKSSGDYTIIYHQNSTGENSRLSTHKFQNIRWMHFSEVDYHLYVVDNLSIYKISPEGATEVVALNLKEGRKAYNGLADHHYIFGICTDKDNSVYVALFGAQKVIKIDTKGAKTTVYESGEGWSPSGVLITSNNTLFIMEFSVANKTRILRLNTDGTQEIISE